MGSWSSWSHDLAPDKSCLNLALSPSEKVLGNLLSTPVLKKSPVQWETLEKLSRNSYESALFESTVLPEV